MTRLSDVNADAPLGLRFPEIPEPQIPEVPYSVFLDLGYRCNARCIHCYNEADDRLGWADPSTEHLLQIIDCILECGTLNLALLGGEPFVRKDLPTVITHIHSRAGRHMPNVGISTNGLLAVERVDVVDTMADISQKVGRPVFQLHVNLQGPVPQVHNRVMGLPYAWERGVEAIKMLVRLRASGIVQTVTIGFTPLQVNFQYLDDMVDFALTQTLDAIDFSQFIPVGHGERSGNLDLSIEQYRRFFKWIALRRRELDGRLILNTHEAIIQLADPAAVTPNLTGCRVGTYLVNIKADGTVTPCPLIPLPLGNVLETGLRQIWDASPELARCRRAEFHGSCNSCRMKPWCRGCRARPYSREGDLFGSDDRCWLYGRSGGGG